MPGTELLLGESHEVCLGGLQPQEVARAFGDQKDHTEGGLGRKLVREEGDLGALRNFLQLCPDHLGRRIQKGRRKLTGHRIHLFINQMSVIIT